MARVSCSVFFTERIRRFRSREPAKSARLSEAQECVPCVGDDLDQVGTQFLGNLALAPILKELFQLSSFELRKDGASVVIAGLAGTLVAALISDSIGRKKKSDPIVAEPVVAARTAPTRRRCSPKWGTRTSSRRALIAI